MITARCLAPLVLLAAACAACAQTPLTTHTLPHQDRTRTYHLQVPPGHSKDRAVPLVVALHGGGGQGKRMNRSVGGTLGRAAARRGWIVAYPEGILKGWNDGRVPANANSRKRANVDDLGFVAALIDAVAGSHGIDRSRVYATGISNGGLMSLRLACDLPDRLAAIAPVTASLGKVLETRKPTRPTPVMFVNGTDDPLVPYRGGAVQLFGKSIGEVLSTDASVAWWVRHNGCKGEPTRVTLPDKATLDGCRVHQSTWAGGREGSEVVLLRVQGGGHTWPGGTQYLPRRLIGRLCRDIDASEMILAFFERHRRAQAK